MKKLTRAQFLGRSAATLAGALGVSALPGCNDEASGEGGSGAAPDLVLTNAKVYTVDDQLPQAEAFAVKGGRFVAIGSNDDIEGLAGRGTQVIDAGGMTVTPGFIDAHTHPAGAGVSELTRVNLDLRTMGEIKEALRKRASETPPGEWVLGFKYDDTKVREGRQITRIDLDEAVPDHPVFVSHRGGHVYWVNSKGFQAAGITASTPQPAGGHIYIENGQLNGKIAENATELFEGILPSGSTREERQAGVKLMSELMTASGLTSVHDAGANIDSVIAYQDAYRAGEMAFRVWFMPRAGVGSGDALFDNLKLAGIRTGFGDEYLKVGAVKFGADGAASGRTMAMRTPYVGRPNDFGILRMTQEELDASVEDAQRAGFQVGIHANGDKAIEMVLNSYERAQKLMPINDSRHRLEHCSLLDDALLKRIKAGGYIPTPFWTYVYYHGDKWAEYGDEKMKMMFPHKSFLDYGIPAAGASDYVPGPYEPMMALQSMVTRTDYNGKAWGDNQKITVDQALRVGTLNGAYAAHEENIKGSITAGKLADFVVLAEDPHTVDPSKLKDIKIARTVVGGKTVYEG